MSQVLVIDFGSQVSQLIVRRVREAGVSCVLAPFAESTTAIASNHPRAIILSGGPASVTRLSAKQQEQALAPVWKLGVPVLGICYGQQMMCAGLGGKVGRASKREFGRADVQIQKAAPLFAGFNRAKPMPVWMSHGDRVEALPKGFAVLGTSQNAPFAAIGDSKRHYYGVQFHPEVVHTPQGGKLLANFVRGIAGCKKDWTMTGFAKQAIAELREQIGDAEVLCGLSGGVDSSVAAVLLHQAIGKQLTCIYVDNGLMRQNESAEVVGMFRKHYAMRLLHCKASNQFLQALRGVAEPERKRKLIGKTFIDVFQAEAKKRPKATFLAQGTLYPDVIESVSATGAGSHKIKSHHNVGGLPKNMKLKLVEPLRWLFKDEVRQLGQALGLPKAFIGRHPFPGPGLAVRIPGEITERKLKILRAADAIYLDEIRQAGLYDKIWQAFAVLLPVQSVGVMGDARSYEYVCALRAVTSLDGMTADYYPFPHKFLASVSTRIVNEVKGINRVAYDISSKPPATIEWE